jgi:SOS-response transcriptional repressor LexA
MVQFANESQKKVYLFIEEYINKHLYSPKYRVVAKATGLSVMQVGRVVNQLIDRKMLQRISAKQGLVLPKSLESEVHQ